MTKYIYALVDPFDRLVKYVGRTQNPWVRFQNHRSGVPRRDNRRRHEWLARIKRRGRAPRFMILEVCNHLTAPRAEEKWIKHYGRRGKLTNGPGRTKASFNIHTRCWR